MEGVSDSVRPVAPAKRSETRNAFLLEAFSTFQVFNHFLPPVFPASRAWEEAGILAFSGPQSARPSGPPGAKRVTERSVGTLLRAYARSVGGGAAEGTPRRRGQKALVA